VELNLKEVCAEPRTSVLNMTLPAAAARAPADIDRYGAGARAAAKLLLRSGAGGRYLFIYLFNIRERKQ